MSKSIVTEYTENCIFCGKPTKTQHHLLFGRGIRTLAESDGIKVPVCDNEHNMAGGTLQIHDNPIAEKLSKMVGQLAWEKEYYKNQFDLTGDPAREAFRRRYGKSYL